MNSSRHSFLAVMVHPKPARVLMIASLLPLSAMGANVLVNPGFELAAAGNIGDTGGVNQWSNFNDTAGNAVVQSTIFHSGIQALQLNTVTTGGQGFSLIYQNTGALVATPEIEGLTWNYSFWVYTTGGTGNFRYQFFSSNSSNMDQPGVDVTISADTLIPNTWVEISGSFTSPDASPDSDRMKANFSSANGTSTFYIDDVSLSPVPEPATLGLLALAPLAMLRRRRD